MSTASFPVLSRSPSSPLAAGHRAVSRRRCRGRAPAVLPAWAGLGAGWLGGLPGLASVWAGQEAGRLRHQPGLEPAWADLWAGPNSKICF